ncbi:N-acetylglucosamine-6-phosphate deacetylase [Paenibacillus abyssi]|uniref:N-acetylglucosamine-6-phosphate deacetylase n=1 Tax=Paenibacillus abyssi TaxID=1340531 RepID=A0A917FVR5_9BACL|nr:N-acetylglucosamine-6-phosphate deacetylase [Paenibacillus abyssi]GGG07410.1 N-acetylglucosamine-6-phosphate deacetylase [Paenibacillus abyssi]
MINERARIETTHKQVTLEGRLIHDARPYRITLQDGTISRLELLQEDGRDDLPWIGPGLIDLQINGYAGIDFNTASLSAQDVTEVTARLWKQGVTSFFPTIITNSDENIRKMTAIIAEACRSDRMVNASIPGLHLEGPFLSKADGARGAHDAQYVQKPDWELFQRWQESADGRIKIITLSPEWDDAPEFISKCVDNDVMVSIGHTSASPQQIRAAVAAGARMSTHLGNGAHLTLPRHPNYIWEQLASDELTASIIADGFHLPESVLKVFLRAKHDRIVLVSDAVYLSGLQPGCYETHIGGKVVLTPEGKLHLASNPNLLAGSAQLLRAGIHHLVNSGLCTIAEAWQMASERPASLLGLEKLGRIEAGAEADLVVFTQEKNSLQIQQVYKKGHLQL